MKYTTFITAAEAYKNLDNPDFLFIDCSYALADGRWGRGEYEKGHIPNALYADLHDDLSGAIVAGKTSRHPLPTKAELIATFSRFGITEQTQVVVYDMQSGAMAAARLWWLLQWAGHANVAVLSGGKTNWEKAGFPLSQQQTQHNESAFKADFKDELLVQAGDVMEEISTTGSCIIDSRTNDRYQGQNETIDPIAGHIPKAVSMPFNTLLNPEGMVEDSAQIGTYFESVPDHAVFYCGSGVTAAFNILLFVHARRTFPKLYAGSWSEWITDQSRPVE
ncbi:sulfurtransferase [Pedobacter sp. MC2016-15]|uniref:sulfurtransferase n=1 Tax=Pedobacter sp. MC2016-15 TaxID=2994473 RepID=UPI002247AEFE|nr:sulfurtransferase [Pedobacter sp. MC2016-15]MCX2479835.1 sulfurtransferase [Pedobacter sp. MC2016-15]